MGFLLHTILSQVLSLMLFSFLLKTIGGVTCGQPRPPFIWQRPSPDTELHPKLPEQPLPILSRLNPSQAELHPKLPESGWRGRERVCLSPQVTPFSCCQFRLNSGFNSPLTDCFDTMPAMWVICVLCVSVCFGCVSVCVCGSFVHVCIVYTSVTTSSNHTLWFAELTIQWVPKSHGNS